MKRIKKLLPKLIIANFGIMAFSQIYFLLSNPSKRQLDRDRGKILSSLQWAIHQERARKSKIVHSRHYEVVDADADLDVIRFLAKQCIMWIMTEEPFLSMNSEEELMSGLTTPARRLTRLLCTMILRCSSKQSAKC